MVLSTVVSVILVPFLKWLMKPTTPSGKGGPAGSKKGTVVDADGFTVKDDVKN